MPHALGRGTAVAEPGNACKCQSAIARLIFRRLARRRLHPSLRPRSRRCRHRKFLRSEHLSVGRRISATATASVPGRPYANSSVEWASVAFSTRCVWFRDEGPDSSRFRNKVASRDVRSRARSRLGFDVANPMTRMAPPPGPLGRCPPEFGMGSVGPGGSVGQPKTSGGSWP